MENYTNRVITEGRNNMGMVRYCVVDRTNTPNAFCGGSFNTKKQGIEQLKRAKHLYPNHKWTLEAVFSIGGKEKKRKNLGDPLRESANADEFGTAAEANNVPVPRSRHLSPQTNTGRETNCDM